MRAHQAVVSGVVVVVAAMALAAPVFGALPTGQFQTEGPAEGGGEFGEQIAAFAQASAVDANESADQGMWEATVNETSEPAPAVTGRAAALERRLGSLENQSAALQAQQQNGTISGMAYTARASALRVRIANLREAVNETERTARRVGVNATKLDRLRAAASEMRGPEVAELARSITDAPRGPPEGVPGGPPEGAGPGQGGPPDDAGPGQGGPPEGAGPGQGGPPDDARPQESPGSGQGENRSNTPTDDDSGAGDGGPPDDRGDGGAGDGGAGDGGDGDGGSGNGGPPDDRGDGGDGGDGAGDGGAGDGGDGDSGPPDDRGDGGDGDGGAGDGGAGDGGSGNGGPPN